MRGRRQVGFTFTDLVVVLAIVTLVGSMVPVLSCQSRERGNRIKCANNLRTIGQMMKMYENDYKTYPRGPYNPAAPTSASFAATSWNSATIPASQVNDVNVALYLLIRVQELSPDIFVCPSTPDQPMILNGASSNYSAFGPDDKCLSYSLANPYPMSNNQSGAAAGAVQRGYLWQTDARGAEKAIAADRNEASTDLTITGNSPAKQQQSLNSGNHDREGQNVLYDDSHVDWVTTAWAGDGRDNIYTRAKVQAVAGTTDQWTQLDPPQSDPAGGTDPAYQLDSVLLPVFTPRPPWSRPGSMWEIPLELMCSGPVIMAVLIGVVLLVLRMTNPRARVAMGGNGTDVSPCDVPPPAKPGVVEWFYLKDGEPVGPFTLEQLSSMRQSGELPPGQLVWCERLGNWAPIETVHIG